VLEVSHFQIDGLHLDLVADEAGGLNILDALVAGEDTPDAVPEKKTSGAGLPLNVKIKNAQITRSAVSFSDPVNTVSAGSLHVTVKEVDLQQMSGEITVNVGDAVFSGAGKNLDIRTIDVFASVQEKKWVTFRMDLDSEMGGLAAAGSVDDLFHNPHMDLTLDITTDLAAVSHISQEMPDLGGNIHLTVAGKGPVNDPAVQVRIKGQQLAMAPDMQDGSLDIAMNLANRVLRLEQGWVDLLGFQAAFSGSTDLSRVFPDGFLGPAHDFEQLNYALSFNQTEGDFQHLAPWIPGFSGKFSSRGRIQGRGISVDTLAAGYELTAVFKGLKQDQSEIDPLDLDIQVSGDMDSQLLTLDQLSVDTRPAQVQASGKYHLADQILDMSLTVSSDDLYAVTQTFGLSPAKGRVKAAVQATGPISGPDISVTLAGRELAAAGILVDLVDFKGNLDPKGRATLTDFTVRGPGLDLAVSGDADLFDTGFTLKKRIRASLKTMGNILPETVLARSDLDVDPQFLDTHVEFDLKSHVDYDMGTAVAIAEVKDITIPRQDLEAMIDLNNHRFSLFLENLADISGVLDMKKSAYTLDIDFKAGDFSPLLTAVGITNISGGVEGWVRSGGTLPRDVTAPLETPLAAAKGGITIKADISGMADQPDVNALISLTDLSWHPESLVPEISDLNGRLSFKDVHLDLLHTHAADSNDVSTAEAGGMIPVKSVQADLGLNRLDEKGLDLQLTLDQSILLDASFNPETSAFDVTATFSATPLDPFVNAAGIFGITGHVDGQIESRGRINMDLPPQITEQLKPAAGSLQLDADVAGSFHDPQINAGIVLDKLYYPVPEAGLTVSNLNGMVTLSNDQLKIEALSAELGQGTLDISGDLGLENFMPVTGQARVLAHHVAVSIEDTLDAAFNTDLTFSGSRENSRVTGSVQLIHGEFYKDFDFDLAEALESRKMGRAGPVDMPSKSGGPSFFEKTTLDIDVNYKDPFLLDNNLAFIMVAPDLKISGTVRQPVLTGRADIAEGTVVYHKRQFEIDKGIIDFVDPFRIDPKITLQASTAIRKWVIYMDVSGKMDNLRFKLYANPAETHEDILSLLIIGKTTRELGKGGGSYTGILADKASEMIGKEVSSSTPLDTFKLGYDESDGQGGNVSVTMGKKLSERLEVIYSMETEEQETVHTNSAEYKMLENVILRAFNDSQGDFGTEITLKLEFR
jgi:autotransporter translocation and assembly factor TamB